MKTENNKVKCRDCKNYKELYFKDGTDALYGLCKRQGATKLPRATRGNAQKMCEHFIAKE